MIARTHLARVGSAVLLLVALGAVSGVAEADISEWEAPQVVDGSDQILLSSLISTERGRAVALYKTNGAVWASSRPPGAGMPWTRPRELAVSRRSSVGPVATNSNGGATVFFDYGVYSYSHIDASGHWGRVRTFPYQDQLDLRGSLVTPDSDLVAGGTTFRRVKVAVKSKGDPWTLSPGLSLGYTALRGLWYDRDGRVHVLITQDQNIDTRISEQRQGVGSSYPVGLYEAVLHKRDGALSWGPLRQWRTGTVGDVYDYSSLSTSLLSTDDGDITALWYEHDAQGDLFQLMRHRDASSGWSPTRSMPVDGISQVRKSSLDDSGTTRLSYLELGSDGLTRQLVTRELSAGGILSDPVPVDSPIPADVVGYGLYSVSAPGGATLLRLYLSSDTGADQRLYRCLPGGACAGIGSMSLPADPGMAITRTGAALLVGVDAVEGCPPARLCSRRHAPPA
ncbi:MAG: hypothetical protein LH645_07555 [Actinomycetia bacterium]|nr:hypothetical protein [Actinomycetes bacterium]